MRKAKISQKLKVELEVLLHFAVYFCFLLLHFGIGILVLVF
jgi:hypothetical protein